MARVSIKEQFGRRDLLLVCWKYIPELVGLLPPVAQWELHRLYQPSRAFSDQEFAAHIVHLRTVEPSLAQRAGKHYSVIFTTFKKYADQVGKTNWEEIRRLVARDYTRSNADPTKTRSVVIMPLVNPDVDARKLAQLLLEQVRRDRAAQSQNRLDRLGVSPDPSANFV